MKSLSILLLEDSFTDCLLLEKKLESVSGFEFTMKKAAKLNDGLALLDQISFDIVLVDLGLPDSHGVDSIGLIKSRAQAPVLVVSGNEDELVAEASLNSGASGFLNKNLSEGEDIARAIRSALAALPLSE